MYTTISMSRELKEAMMEAGTGGVKAPAASVVAAAYRLYKAVANDLARLVYCGALPEGYTKALEEALSPAQASSDRVTVTISRETREIASEYRTLVGGFSPSVREFTDAAASLWLAIQSGKLAPESDRSDAATTIRQVISAKLAEKGDNEQWDS